MIQSLSFPKLYLFAFLLAFPHMYVSAGIAIKSSAPHTTNSTRWYYDNKTQKLHVTVDKRHLVIGLSTLLVATGVMLSKRGIASFLIGGLPCFIASASVVAGKEKSLQIFNFCLKSISENVQRLTQTLLGVFQSNTNADADKDDDIDEDDEDIEEEDEN